MITSKWPRPHTPIQLNNYMYSGLTIPNHNIGRIDHVPHEVAIISKLGFLSYNQNKDNHYNVVIYCPHAKNKDSIKKIRIFNKHLLIHVGKREYRYGIVGEGEYIIPGLICAIYLPLPKDVKDILKYSVKNRIIHVEISKSN